jgi:hypothetical protein
METSVAPVAATLSGDRLNEAATQLRAAADARKCWSCGCFRHALEAFDRAIPEPERPAILAEAMASATDRLLPKKYECLGCDVCYPAVALNALVALARNGVNDDRRIINAKGKRPELRNLELTAIDHFRKTVEVIDLIGNTDVKELSAAVRECADRTPGAAEPFAPTATIMPVTGRLPKKMVSNPAGYFVIFIDRVRRRLNLEHYKNNGVLTAIIEGCSAAEVYMTAIERGLLTRLDHAAYLGRELTRAEHALSSGETYAQEAAPEQCSNQCSCHQN